MMASRTGQGKGRAPADGLAWLAAYGLLPAVLAAVLVLLPEAARPVDGPFLLGERWARFLRHAGDGSGFLQLAASFYSALAPMALGYWRGRFARLRGMPARQALKGLVLGVALAALFLGVLGAGPGIERGFDQPSRVQVVLYWMAAWRAPFLAFWGATHCFLVAFLTLAVVAARRLVGACRG